MEQITKKAFKVLHSGGMLVGIYIPPFKKSKEDILLIIQNQGIDLVKYPTFKTSRIDLANDHDYRTTTTYRTIIQGIQCYFVETIEDNSKNPNCSWDSVDTNTIIYREA